MKKSTVIGVALSHKERENLEDLAQIWGYRSLSAFFKAAVNALPSRLKLEHLEAHEENSLVSSILSVMKGGRK